MKVAALILKRISDFQKIETGIRKENPLKNITMTTLLRSDNIATLKLNMISTIVTDPNKKNNRNRKNAALTAINKII